MTQPRDRDAALDRLLHALPADEIGPTPDCLDAETAAAYVDGGLPEPERRAYMAHAATCDHCQALLGALIRSEPPAPEARAWWQLRPWPWLVPALGAAAALAIFVAVDRPPAVTVVSAPPPVAEPKRMAAVDEREAKPSLDPLAREELERQMSAPFALTEPIGPPSLPRQPAEGQAKARAASADAVVPAELTARADAAIAVPPPAGGLAGNTAPPPAALPSTTAPSQAFAAGRPLTPMVGGAAPGAPPVGQQSESVVLTDAPGAASALRRVSGAPAPIEVRSSDPRVRWRIVGSAVERSADGGSTWTPQALGVSSRLTGGSAPLPEVCWIVGDGGTVVVTADGISWTRVAFPEAVPLASVSATSADAATVTTSDGRLFTTTDRGKTWR